ncbi:hypothetical protein E2562_032623 [Oryza meyeriana var. granulata]|uniref:Uncharacterized protein n=1 Tax=Oryza meyeriana var. granulata TaxID=110450 RepID=A0A6G1D901_9ORYZ|nr:hypothetical protein E2562_032623 [Oryza meyeriana var. granulata]
MAEVEGAAAEPMVKATRSMVTGATTSGSRDNARVGSNYRGTAVEYLPDAAEAVVGIGARRSRGRAS